MINSSIVQNFNKETQKLCNKVITHLHSIPIEKDTYTHLSQNIENIIAILYNEMFLGTESIIAGLLYRYIQYKYVTIEDIEKLYGSKIKRIAAGAARIGKLSKTKMQYHTEYFIQLILSLADDPRSILIMLAEQLDKMRNFKKLPEHIKDSVLKEDFFLYAPIAHRLGLYAIKTELQELWLKFDNYTIFRKIADELAAKKKVREAYITDFIKPIQATMSNAGISCDIKGRPKSIYSIWEKMNSQNIGLEHIFDQFAIRIIIDEIDPKKEKELCWKVYSLVTEKYKPNPTRLRDWISFPKVSGYESLHTTVLTEDNHWIEIQIRSQRMDDNAEKGNAAHWRYKEFSKGEVDSTWLSKMRESLKNPEESDTLGSSHKEIPFSNYMYVFTPDEDLIRLKNGSTILDIAFQVHTNVGLTCTGARVNGEFVPIKHILKNGDVVEIITSKNQKPSEQWLKIITSSKIKAKVRRALRTNERTNSVIGKEMLRQKFKTIGIDFSSENLEKIAAHFGHKNITDLFEAVGQLKIDLLKVKRFFAEEHLPQEPMVPDIPDIAELPANRQNRNHSDCIIIDKAIHGVEYTIAPCCNPVMGDAIFCFVTVSKGMRVHKTDCPNANDMYTHSPHRIIKAQWSKAQQTQLFSTHIKIAGTDERNILSTIINTFKDVSDAKMTNCSVSTSITSFNADLFIDVVDKNALEEIIKKIMKIKGVVRVWRVG